MNEFNIPSQSLESAQDRMSNQRLTHGCSVHPDEFFSVASLRRPRDPTVCGLATAPKSLDKFWRTKSCAVDQQSG